MKKNDLLLIFFTKSLIWHHTPKIIDQAEISATLRAHKNMIVANIPKNCKILISFLHFCLSIEGRGMSEISAWSMIFGVWPQKHISVKLWASATRVAENMAKNTILVEKMASFKQKWWKNEISNLVILILDIMKNHEKKWFGDDLFYKKFGLAPYQKIIDQTEISATLRAYKNMILNT